MKRLTGLWIYARIAWRLAPGSLTAVVVVQALASGSALVIGLGMQQVVNGVIAHDMRTAVTGAGLAAAALAMMTAGSRVADTTYFVVAQKVAEHIDLDVLRMCASRMGMAHLEDPALLHRVEQARTPAIRIAAAQFNLFKAVLAVLQVVLSVAMLASVSWILPALALCTLPSLRTGAWTRGRLRRLKRELADKERTVSHVLEAAIVPASAKEMRLRGAASHLSTIADRAERHMAHRRLRTHLLTAVVDAVGWAVFAAAYTGALLLTYQLARSGETGPGSVLMVASLGGQLRNQIGTVTAGLRRSGVHLEAFEEYLWLRDSVAGQVLESREAVSPPDRLTDGIELRDVSFRYAEDADDVLKDVTLRIPAGTTVALVGEHGCGKTTLVKLLCGLYEPTNGTVTIDGVPLVGINRREWLARGAVAFQDFSRWEFTAQRTVGIGDLPRIDDPRAVAAAATSVGADQVFAELAEGASTQLGQSFGPGRELSGGQWQKLALARTFMRRRPLLAVLDEPTASLDAEAEAVVYRRYEAAAGEFRTRVGAVTVLVSHRFSTIQMADLIVVLADGRIAESGTHDELVGRTDGLYAGLYALQSSAYR